MLSGRETDYAQDSAMRSHVDDGQLAEVLVQRYKDPLLTIGDGKNLVVSGIAGPLTRPSDVVTGCSEFPYRTTPDTGIQ